MMRTFLVVAIAIVFFNNTEAQNLTAVQVKNLVEGKRYTFEAQTMNPQRGATKQLTPDYSLQVTDDSLISYLPYFGRAYSARLMFQMLAMILLL